MQVPGTSSGFQLDVRSSAQSSLLSVRGEQARHGDKQPDKPSGKDGAHVVSEVSSNFSEIEKGKVFAAAEAQRADNDVRLSDEGIQRSLKEEDANENVSANLPNADREKLELTAEIRQLSQRDQEVRNHERIHASIAGAHGGTPSFQFQRGPNGVLYAVSGSVSIDLSVVPGNAEATVRKAEQIERAALAPSDPSGADRAVAAKARSLANQARVELANDGEVHSDKNTSEDASDVTPKIASNEIASRDQRTFGDNVDSSAREKSALNRLGGKA